MTRGRRARSFAAAERLATASSEAATAGNDYAQARRRPRDGPARGAAPARRARRRRRRVGRTGRPQSKRMRIAPVAAGETIGRLAARAPSGDRRSRRHWAARRRSRARHADGVSQRTPSRARGASRTTKATVGTLERRARLRRGADAVVVRLAKRKGSSTSPRTSPIRVAARDAWVDAARAIASAPSSTRPADARSCSARRTRNVKRFAAIVARAHRPLHPRTRASATPAGSRRRSSTTKTSVLVGTRSFWAGIDAAGAACVLVVIDRIPFPAPDEPAARGPPHTCRAERPQPVRRRRSSGGRARARPGRGPAPSYADRSRCCRGARPAPGGP